MQNHLISRYFVKPTCHSDQPKLLDHALRRKTDHLMKRFDAIAQKCRIPLDQQQSPWPFPVDEEPVDAIIPPHVMGSYDYLDDAQFDADIGFCVVSSLSDVDPAIAHLALRDRQFIHLCLLTHDPLPTYELEIDRDAYRGVMALPAKPLSSIQTFRDYEKSDFIKNPLQAGIMSIASVEEISDKKLRALLWNAHQLRNLSL